MIVVLALFGHEVFRIELATPAGSDDEQSEETVTSRHAGSFDFGFSPARPYWSHDGHDTYGPPVASSNGVA